MSEYLKTTLIEPSIVSEITDVVTYAVQSGAAKSTYTTFNADNISQSGCTFNIRPPSQSVVVDRAVKISTTMTLKFMIGNTPATAVPYVGGAATENSEVFVFNYGMTESFQAYPINSLIRSTNYKVNNAGESSNNMIVNDILATVTNHAANNKKNSSTPTYHDSLYGQYNNCVGTSNNPMAGVGSSGLNDNYVGRGAHPVQMVVIHMDSEGEAYPAVSVTGSANATLTSLRPAAAGDQWTIYVTGDFMENFIGMSPFLSTLSHDQQGFMGINDLYFDIAFDTECRRVFSTANVIYDPLVDNSLKPRFISKVSVEGQNGTPGFVDTKLHFNFLSLQASQMARIKSPQQTLPFMKFNDYVTTNLAAPSIPAFNKIPGTGIITSNSLSVATIPDRIFIAARVPLQYQTIAQPSCFLAIKKITINFDNGDSLLNTCSREQLYNISVKNGSNQSYQSFCGRMSLHDNNAEGFFKTIPSLGSCVCINPAEDLSIAEFFTNGSIGQFNLTVTVDLENYYDYPVKPELVLVLSNGGILQISSGIGSFSTSLMTTKMVMDAKTGPVNKISTSDYDRLLGGVSPAAQGLANFRRNKTKSSPDSGSGMSASGMSGAGITGSGRKIDRLY
jgi:hypothetical protein